MEMIEAWFLSQEYLSVFLTLAIYMLHSGGYN